MTRSSPIRIAVQSNGRLSVSSLDYLQFVGLQFKINGRLLITPVEQDDVEILHLRDDDIPEYVSRGVANFGIVGKNVLIEKGVVVKILKELGFGICSLVIAVPEGSSIRELKDLEGERIATSHPRILSKFFKEKGLHAAIIPIKGSVEIAPRLNLADAICDLTQTGNTLRENRLFPFITVLQSQAVLIESPIPHGKKSQVWSKRLCG